MMLSGAVVLADFLLPEDRLSQDSDSTPNVCRFSVWFWVGEANPRLKYLFFITEEAKVLETAVGA